jgi:hypothetical protein
VTIALKVHSDAISILSSVVAAAAALAVAAAVVAGKVVQFSLGCENNGNINLMVNIMSIIYSETDLADDAATVPCSATAQIVTPNGGTCSLCVVNYKITQNDLDHGFV